MKTRAVERMPEWVCGIRLGLFDHVTEKNDR